MLYFWNMKKILFFVFASSSALFCSAQLTRFEISKGLESAPYEEAVAWYQKLDKDFSTVKMQAFGNSDAGLPLHVVLTNKTGNFSQVYLKNQVLILINNGIHPGEPDGIDASMMLVRDIVTKKYSIPNNVTLAIIPVYNIGGALNRGRLSRVNQNGPLAYGFRGNSQNLDLNRDFTKNDSKEAQTFATIFHFLKPDIFIDNHVSDGADYQHTMTLLTTQYEKLGLHLGAFLKKEFEPSIYNEMRKRNWPLFPYVNFETDLPETGMDMFYDPPRYSSGYASLFQCIAFVPETHMLKPYSDRVKSTYDLMLSIIETAGEKAKQIKKAKQQELQSLLDASSLPLAFKLDSTKFDTVTFLGYEAGQKTSAVTGQNRMYYDRAKPFAKQVQYNNAYLPNNIVKVPKAYILQQGYADVVAALQRNQVQMIQLKKDSTITVEEIRIEDYKSLARPYEKHHKNHSVKTKLKTVAVLIKAGSYYIPTQQAAKRYLVEVLEPTGDDSFFAWNFFDGILQQKEGYSNYRWEDVAAEIIEKNSDIKAQLESKKLQDPAFAKNASAQLDFVYKLSSYYEPTHNLYPVYKLY